MPKTLTSTKRDFQESSYERFKSLDSPIRICGHCHYLSTSDQAWAHVCFKTSKPAPEDDDEFGQERLSAQSAQPDNSLKLIAAIIVCGVVLATIFQFKSAENKSEFEIQRQVESATLPAQSDTPSNGVVGMF